MAANCCTTSIQAKYSSKVNTDQVTSSTFKMDLDSVAYGNTSDQDLEMVIFSQVLPKGTSLARVEV